MTHQWKPGDRLRHRFNKELGPGLVEALEERTIVVHFPESDTSLRLARNTDALVLLELPPGTRAMLLPDGDPVIIDREAGPGRILLTDGREVEERLLWPMQVDDSLVDRLAQGDVDRLDRFAVRLDALHLAAIREADGLGSFLGGRIRLFPHQLHAAEHATRSDPVRWLLADEVGLGKTVEVCLILNHLLQTGRADRTLVVAPETLTVQWLGELWRKYHQVFVLLDEKRLADVEKDYGKGFNPFEAHARVVVGIDFLKERPRLTELAMEAEIDLLIVDEAHHLRRRPGHPGNAEYRSVRPITELGRHVLLLTATPLDEDALGYFRLLQLLRPEEFPEDEPLENRLNSGEPLPPCTSATRRVDIGGLPPRVAEPVTAGDAADWAAQLKLEQAVRSAPASNAATRKAKARRIRRALASGASLEALLDASDEKTIALARNADRKDPRLAWLAEQAGAWQRAGDRTLVFVAHRETLEIIRAAMSRRAQLRTGVFHEDLSAGQRDIEVAQFRLPSGPSMLVSTECGGEGRNFEFCTRLVLFDLPWNPMTVEQRIGRLDRIGRRRPVELVYFRPPSGLGALIADLYESLGIFRQPLGGIERELASVEGALGQAALSRDELPDASAFANTIEQARTAYDRVQESAHHELHRNPYRGELAEAILERVPPELDELTEEVVLAIAEQIHLHVEEHRDGRRHSIELGKHARVLSLSGVAPGASFLGSFDRMEAIRDESIDFYASGHPLVEGLLAHLEDSPAGRVAILSARAPDGQGGFGLLALYKDGPEFEAVAVDIEGRRRPEWAAFLTSRPLKSRRVKPEVWTKQRDWPKLVRKLAASLPEERLPEAVAAFHLE